MPDDISPHIYMYWHAVSLVSGAFWVWMCVDAYRRRGGLDTWHYMFFFFPPSTFIYFVLHFKQIIGRGGAGTSTGGLFGLGLSGRIKQAQQQLRISDTLQARSELAELYFQADRFDECENEFKKVLQADSRNLEAIYHLGLCRLKRNDAPGALEYLTRVMELDKKLRFGIAWLRYTECLVATGKRVEAMEERRKLCRSYPRPLTEYAYAELLAESGKTQQAREALDEMLGTSDNAPIEDRIWLKRGKALMKKLAE